MLLELTIALAFARDADEVDGIVRHHEHRFHYHSNLIR